MSRMFQYLVVEGPIGVGKTSLAKRLAESIGAELLLEQAYDNPFLKRFYENERGAALSAQLFFLLQRAQQAQRLQQKDMFELAIVSDYLFQKDRLFAELTLDNDEFNLYQQVYRLLAQQSVAPDLVIYLQAPVEILLERIAKRGIECEKHIGAHYLTQLSDAYTKFFHQYTAAPLLIVNTADIDFVNDERDYNQLLERILDLKSGRNYFNPLPFAMGKS